MDQDINLPEVLRLHKLHLAGDPAGKRADLSGRNLIGAFLRCADLRGADLRNADLRGADLWGANLWGARLEGARLEGADLREAQLVGANLADAVRPADPTLCHCNMDSNTKQITPEQLVCLNEEQVDCLVAGGWHLPDASAIEPPKPELPEGWPEELRTLTLINRDSGRAIEGTVDRLDACAEFCTVEVDKDGCAPNYSGTTEVWWDSQMTQTDPASKAQYYWDGLDVCTFDECDVVDSSGVPVGNRLNVDQVLWLRQQLW